MEWESLATPNELPSLPVGGDSIADVLKGRSTKVTGSVKVQPTQFHFHSVSEHSFDGFLVRANLETRRHFCCSCTAPEPSARDA